MPALKKNNIPKSGQTWGIVGGTFNPVHLGHLVMAEAVRESQNADGMLFVPARNHPFKSNDIVMASYSDRLAMLDSAIAGNDRFYLEEPPQGPGYTINLLNYLKDLYPEVEFFLPIGSDIIEEFGSWHKHDEIIKMIRIVIADRPGYSILCKDNNILLSAERVDIPQYDVSSSNIRKRVKNRLSIRYMVTLPVEKYIREKGLYVD